VKNKFITLALLGLLNTSLCAAQYDQGSWNAFNPDIEMRCPRPPPGPPGPPGPPLAQNFAAAFTDTSQPIPVAAVFTPIIFAANRFTPVGIVHPVGTNATQFQVLADGFYNISWDYTAISFLAGVVQLVQTQLFNVTTATVIPPSPFQTFTLQVDEIKAVSGDVLVFLPANTIIDLEVMSDGTSVLIDTASFNIIEISP
jgi:hypothetical protein